MGEQLFLPAVKMRNAGDIDEQIAKRDNGGFDGNDGGDGDVPVGKRCKALAGGVVIEQAGHKSRTDALRIGKGLADADAIVVGRRIDGGDDERVFLRLIKGQGSLGLGKRPVSPF